MRKFVLIIWLLCACVLLSACTASDPNNLFEIPSDTQNSQPDSENTYTGAYQYSNMQNPAGNGFMLLDNEVIFTHITNGQTRLYAYDLITEEVRYYCNDATCKHENCVAGQMEYNIEVFDGKLYGLIWSNEKDGINFYPAMVNGNDAEVIIEASIYSFFHHEDKLYMLTSDNSLVALEDGQSEPQMVMDEFTGGDCVIFGEYLYFDNSDFSFTRVKLTEETPKEEVLLTNVLGNTDGEHIYYTDIKTNMLYRCNMDGSNSVLLSKNPVVLGGVSFDEEYCYYRLYTDGTMYENADSHDIYRFPKKDPTQIEKIATLPEPAWLIYTVPGTGKLFVTNYFSRENVEPTYYVMNTDGSNLKKLELPES